MSRFQLRRSRCFAFYKPLLRFASRSVPAAFMLHVGVRGTVAQLFPPVMTSPPLLMYR